MRIIEQSPTCFIGTHKGAYIEIEKDLERARWEDPRFYITVRWKDGTYMYDGWANVATISEAKREAVRGSCLTRPLPERNTP